MQQKRFDLLKVGKTSKTVKIIPPVILLSMERKLNLVSLNKDEFTKYGPAVKTWGFLIEVLLSNDDLIKVNDITNYSMKQKVRCTFWVIVHEWTVFKIYLGMLHCNLICQQRSPFRISLCFWFVTRHPSYIWILISRINAFLDLEPSFNSSIAMLGKVEFVIFKPQKEMRVIFGPI